METSGNLHTSTPFQCRHDSGFGSYIKDYGFSQELSPIRKQSSISSKSTVLHQVQRYLRYWKKGNCDVDMVTKKLTFSNLSEVNDRINFYTDSGIGCNINVSTSESQKLSDKEANFFTDENCNVTWIHDCTAKDKLYQPLKYICKDHLHEKGLKSNKHNTYDDVSEIFKSFDITSELIKVKREKKNSKLDLLHELDIRNCTGVISDILSYLSGEDLRQANNVSKTWRLIVFGDKNANERRNVYLDNRRNAAHGPNKENKFKTASAAVRDHKSAFTSIANVGNETKQPLAFDNLLGRFDSFFQELQIGGQQALMKCPKCRYPARIESGYKYCCTRNLCKHEFCKKCLGPYFDNHVCSAPELNNSSPNITVCSKKSRKNLRRLKA